MKERSYRLAQYEIIEQHDGGIRWKAHRGFAAARGGECFIEGDVLFIGPDDIYETGFLKNEFLEHLREFPQWDGTKYYCPSYTLYTCKSNRRWHGSGRSRKDEVGSGKRRDKSSMPSTAEAALTPFSRVTHISRVRGKFGEAVRSFKGLVGLSSEKDDSNE